MPQDLNALPLNRMAAHMLEKIRHHIIYLDRNGQIMYANPSACARLGYSNDGILTKTLFDISPETSDEAWSYDWDQITGGQLSVLHRYYQDQAGNDFPVEVFSVPYDQEDDSAYLCSLITDQANTEEYRELLEMLENASGMGGIAWTLHSGHITATRGALSLLGTHRPRALAPDQIAERIDIAYRAEWYRKLDALVKSGQPLNFHMPVHTYDGQYKWLEASMRAVASSHNGIDKIEGIYRELPPRGIEEQSLGSALLQQSPELVLLIDRAGRIVFATPALERLLGYTNMATDIFVIEQDLSASEWEARWQQMSDSEKAQRIDVRACRANGTLLNVEVTYRPFSWQQSQYMHYHLRDTERFRQREAALRTAMSAYQQSLAGADNQTDSSDAAGNFLSLDDAQRLHIVRALMRTNWRVSGENGAARLLDINAKTLFARMKKLGIRREDY